MAQGIFVELLPLRLPPAVIAPLALDPDRWVEILDGVAYARRVTQQGAIMLDGWTYYVGLAHAGRDVTAQIDAKARQIVVYQGKTVLKRVTIKGLVGAPLPFADFVAHLVKETTSPLRKTALFSASSLQRTTPLERKTPLVQKTPLERKTPLRQRTPLRRHTALRRHTPLRRSTLRHRAARRRSGVEDHISTVAPLPQHTRHSDHHDQAGSTVHAEAISVPAMRRQSREEGAHQPGRAGYDEHADSSGLERD
jgi:hypothetical protein